MQNVFEYGSSATLLRWTTAASLLLIAIIVSQFSLSSAVLLCVFGALGFALTLPLRTLVLALTLFIPFDLQRPLGGAWVYLDLSLALVIPFLLRKRLPSYCFVLLPFFGYMFFTGFYRALGPYWFYAYLLRFLLAMAFAAAILITDRVREFVVFLGFTLIPQLLYGLYQIAIDGPGKLYGWIHPHFSEQVWIHGRAVAFMWQPNVFGGWAALVTVMLSCLGTKGYKRKTCFSLAAFGLGCVITSGSRGAFVALLVAGIFVLGQTGNFRKKFLALFAAGAIIWFGVYYGVITSQRDIADESYGILVRLEVWNSAMERIKEHPYLGIGATNFAETASSSLLPLNLESNIHAHSTYLQLLAEEGVFGFLIFYGTIILALVRSWKNRSDMLGFAMFCALVVFLFHGTVDFMMTENPQYLVLVVAAIIIGARPVPAMLTLEHVQS